MVNRSKTKVTLASVITRIRLISSQQYDGRTYDNILAIYNQLTAVERRVLLRGLIGICFIVEEKILADAETIRDVKQAVVETGKNIQENMDHQLELQNQKALVGLKIWGVKMMAILVVVGLIGMMLGAYFLTGEINMLERFDHVLKILKTAFGV